MILLINIKNQCFHLELCFSKAKWHQIRRSNSIIANYTAKTDRDDDNGYRNYEHKYLIYEQEKKLMVAPRIEKTSCPTPNH
jgi:hypothetical protein